MESEFFNVEVENGVARCSMNGPTMNAMGVDMLPPMMEGLRFALDSDDVVVIIIRGEGGNFSTGADLSIMGENMDPVQLKDNMRAMGALIYELHEGPKPVITEVDGWAVGGGFGLAMSSDITYTTERARFYLSFVRLSIVPDFGSSYFLTRRVGLSLAKELAMTGRVIDAEEALRIGLINRVVPHEEISAEVMKLAGKMAGRTPNILALIKRSLNTGHQVDLKTSLEMEAHVQALAVLTPEHRQDVENFMKKMGG
ncbi:MAG: enoyl-CoA hydratase-related protein [Actinomycetota bacterium]|nr:enoyl-CoA hydratase-related protein [Actinomycetota bacterium]